MMTASGIYPFEDQPEKVFLQLTAKPAVKQGDKWFCTVVVHAHLRGHVNFPDCPLVLLVDGKNVGRATGLGDIVTNDQGLFSHPIQLPGPGRWLVGVKIKDTSIMAQEWVETPEEKKRRPEEEGLVLHRLRLEKAKVEQELTKLQAKPSSREKKLADARLRLELARIDAELKKLGTAPSDTERNVSEARLKLELARITAELEKFGAQPSSLETELAETRLQRDLAKTKQELAEIGKRPERPPKTLSVERIGRKPRLQFAIGLTAADGRGTKGMVEAICLGHSMERVEIDENGSRVWPDTPVDFPEKMRRYRFRIAGTDIADKNATRECVVF